MANTLSTYTERHKYFQANLAHSLRNTLVSEAICNVDRTDLKTIENPYISEVTATIQAVAGTYTPTARTTTDDTLSVDDEVIAATHVYDFEMRTSNFNLTANFLDQLMYETAKEIDAFVINKITSQAGSTYTTPTGGFTTASNVPTICANLLPFIAGFQTGQFGRPFLIVEDTDLPGIVQTQIGSGFNYADTALNNGFIANYMGIDIHVVRSGTFQTGTLGTLSATNSGHRLFGVKNVATYAEPRGITYEEKGVSGKTGKEVVAQGQIGAKLWTPKADLFVNITLA